MKRRSHVSRKSSKKLFRKTARKTNGKNYRSSPMRGGIRL